MIRRLGELDFPEILTIINDGAQAYKGVIPADRWTDPYMTPSKLRREIAEGIEFWGLENNGSVGGVMGIQRVQVVTLIRHAYVRSEHQKKGIGRQLLAHLQKLATGPVLVGTWVDAVWAVRFYEGQGFRKTQPADTERLLRKYWTVPERQIATSVVLVDQRWWDAVTTATPGPDPTGGRRDLQAQSRGG